MIFNVEKSFLIVDEGPTRTKKNELIPKNITSLFIRMYELYLCAFFPTYSQVNVLSPGSMSEA